MRIYIALSLLCLLKLALGCKDVSDSGTCDFYRKRGYCKTVDWLAKKCLKTCGFCDCKDTATPVTCELYKRKGYCDTVDWLAKKCMKTCGLCGTLPAKTTSTPKVTTVHTTTKLITRQPTTRTKTTKQTMRPSTITTTRRSSSFAPTMSSGTTSKQGETCGQSTVRGRVIGGTTSRYGQWPWQASLIYNRIGNCGATLITPEWLVTAAHCTTGKNVSLFKVTLGKLHRYRASQYEQTKQVKLIVEHENYKKPVRVDNDIALLKLESPVHLNKYVNTACLPTQDVTPKTGTKCYISGWGKTMPGGFRGAQELQHTSLKILNHTECAIRNKHLAPITKKMICGSNALPSRQSGCHGDSGGPFVCQQDNGRWFLQGAVSWGSPKCKISDGATVFSRISFYRDWIDSKLKKQPSKAVL